MKEILAKLLNSQEGILLVVISVVIGTNVVLTASKKVLGWLKDKTANKADDNAYALVVKVLGWLDKGLEFASANSTALPPKVKAELDKKEWKAEEAQAKAEEVSKELASVKVEGQAE